MKARSSFVAASVVALLCVLTAPAGATFVDNGDFSLSPDFQDWKGLAGDVFSTTTLLEPPPDSFAANYSIVSGAAQLTTTFSTMVPDVVLFQEMNLTSVAAGTALKLAFDLVALDAPGPFGAILSYGCDMAFDPMSCTSDISLLPGSTTGTYMTDVSSAAGTYAVVAFSISAEFDASTFAPINNSSMTIDNVSLARSTTVPAPVTLGLFAAGVVLLWGRLRAFRRRARPLA